MTRVACVIFTALSIAAAPAKEMPALPASVPDDLAKRIRSAVAEDPSVIGDLGDLWAIDGLLDTNLPPLPTRSPSGAPGRSLGRGRMLVVFAISTCPASVDQVRRLLKAAWKHPLADDIVVVVQSDSWPDYQEAIPELDHDSGHVALVQWPLPGRLAEFRGTPFSLLVEEGRVLAGRVGSEGNSFGAWQWPAKKPQGGLRDH